MSKKFLTTGIIAMLLLFFSTAFCFASENSNNSGSNNVDLGNELTKSMNKVEKKASDMTDNIKGDSKDNMDNAVGGMGNKIKSDYDATRTSVDTTLEDTTGMNGTTWIWIILAVIGIVILATVWFYAMQNSNND